MANYILIPIFIVIAAVATKYLAPIVLYILKVPHKLVMVVNLLLNFGIFAGTFLSLYLWSQPRVLADSAIVWGEMTYQQAISLIPEDGFFPTSEPTKAPTNRAESPTKTPVPTKTPTRIQNTPNDSSLPGVVKTNRLNLRGGPGTDYPILGRLEIGDEVNIVQRNAAGDWLFIETEDDKTGWIAGRYIKVEGNLKQVSVALNVGPPPPSPQKQATPLGNTGPESFDAGNGQAYGTVDAASDKWYTFVSGDQSQSTLLMLMFSPNVNLNGRQAQFFIYEEKHSPNWPPNWPDTIPNLGAGSSPPSDLNGDMSNGELLWKGDLIRGARYYLRIINSSSDSLRYCLVTKEVKEWVCPP